MSYLIGAVLTAPYTGPIYWTLVANAMFPEAERQGLRLSKCLAPSAVDQVRMVHELLDQGVQALVIKPMYGNDEALCLALDQALAAGIPVVALESTIAHPAVLATVGSDNRAGMCKVTTHALETLGRRGSVVYFAGDERLSAGGVRNAAFYDTVRRYPEVTVLAQETLDWVNPVSRIGFSEACMRRVLQAHPRFDGLIAAGDEAAIGAVNEIRRARAAGRWPGPAPVVVGFNGLAEALLLVQSGEMSGTISQSPEWVARIALQRAVDCIRSGAPPVSENLVHNELVTQANVAEFAMKFLHLVPRFIAELGDSQVRERELQQEVIRRQRSALLALSKAADVLTKFRQPEEMIGDLCRLLEERFPALSTHIVTLEMLTADTTLAAARRLGESTFFGESLRWSAEGECASVRRRAISADEARPYRTAIAAAGATDEGLRGGSLPRFEPSLAATLFPLVADEHDYGALAVQMRAGGPLDDETTQILTAIAYQLLLALESVELHEETLVLAAGELNEARLKLVHAERAEYLSNHDELTGLPNRRFFASLAERSLNEARRYDRRMALFYLDLDRFKLVNDTMGHEAGDALLRQVGVRLRGALRQTDTPARIGGDEFVVLVPDLEADDHLDAVAEKLMRVFATPFDVSGRALDVLTSVGAAVFPVDGLTVEALMKSADLAMYEAKRSGKNRFSLTVAVPGQDAAPT